MEVTEYLGKHGRLPWRVHECFHYPSYIQMETMGNLLRKHASMFQIFHAYIPCRLLIGWMRRFSTHTGIKNPLKFVVLRFS